MKISCRYSGVTFTMHDFGNLYVDVGEHPLMSDSIKTEQLLHVHERFLDDSLSTMERRILFVAFMKKTGLYRFDVPASPSPDIVLMNMEPLVTLVVKMDAVVTRDHSRMIDAAKFPKFVIAPYNRHCGGIHEHLQICHEKIEDARNNFKNEKLRQRLDDVEAKILKLLKSPYDNPQKKMKSLAHWLMIASNAPKALWEEWEDMICTPLDSIAIFKLHTATLNELYDHVHENLPQQFSYNSPIIAREVISHVNTLWHRHNAGISFHLGIEDDEFDISFLDKNSSAGFRIIDNETATEANMSLGLDDAPLVEPQRYEFSTNFAYLMAKAKFTTAQHTRSKLYASYLASKQFEETQKNRMITDMIENSFAGEDKEDEIDPRQLGLLFGGKKDMEI